MDTAYHADNKQETVASGFLAATVPQNHGIIKCFGLEVTFSGHIDHPPCSEQGHLQLDQVAQSPVQPGLECFQGWGLHYLSGKPVSVFHHTHCKKYPPKMGNFFTSNGHRERAENVQH